jgi:hypothetical protein
LTDTANLIDTWTERDLPVLRAAAARLDLRPGHPVTPRDLSDDTDISTDDCIRAAFALDGLYLSCSTHITRDGELVQLRIIHVSDRGRRATGLWPAEDTFPALLAVLAEMEARSAEPVRESRRRRVIGTIGDVGFEISKQVLIEAVTKALTSG